MRFEAWRGQSRVRSHRFADAGRARRFRCQCAVAWPRERRAL